MGIDTWWYMHEFRLKSGLMIDQSNYVPTLQCGGEKVERILLYIARQLKHIIPFRDGQGTLFGNGAYPPANVPDILVFPAFEGLISRYFGGSYQPSWAYFAVLQCPSLNIVDLPVIGVLQWFESTPWDGYLRDVFRWVGMMLDGKVLEIIYQSEIASTRQAVLMPPPYVNATPTGDNFLFKMACV